MIPVPSVIGAVLTGLLWAAALFTHDAARIVGPLWLVAGVGVYLYSRRAAGKSVLGRATPAVPDLVPDREGEAQSLLVPLKLGPIGEEVLATALRLADERGARVRVLHVVRVPMSLPLDAPDVEGEDAARAAVEEALEIAEEHGAEVTAHVARGRSLAQAILDDAELSGADLILMGSSPRWRLQSRLFSPTVDEVLRRAPVEVMVVMYPPGVLPEAEGGY